MEALRPESWADDIRVDERRLQEYLCAKNHGLVLKGAADKLKHTLQRVPTIHAPDGYLHFGDSLMLRNHSTEGLLQGDAVDPVHVADSSRPEVPGGSLSTGRMIFSCPRNVFTFARADNNDGFADDPHIHYDQAFRLGAHLDLFEKALYLYGSKARTDDLAANETLVCLYPRAAPNTHWRIMHADPRQREARRRQVVELQEPSLLENVVTGQRLTSDTTIRMNNYGNEWRVFGSPAPPPPKANAFGKDDAGKIDPRVAWTFVDEQWACTYVADAREAAGLARNPGDTLSAERLQATRELGVAGNAPLDAPVDPGELLVNPVALADHELKLLETEQGASDFKVIERIYPQLRRTGMHTVRKARRMCYSADFNHTGTVPMRTFEGLLSYVGVRLQAGEFDKLGRLFETSAGSQVLDYARFFSLMQPEMKEVRVSAVRDAYAKLVRRAPSGLVHISHVQEYWNPGSHPECQSQRLSETEAQEDFFGQWDIATADGLVSFEVFLDYYRDVSMAVEEDDIFVEIVRCAWELEQL